MNWFSSPETKFFHEYYLMYLNKKEYLTKDTL